MESYRQNVIDQFGVDLNCREFGRTKRQWSTRVQRAFIAQGKTWNAAIKGRVKACVADVVSNDIDRAIQSPRSAAINALVSTLEERLQGIE